MAYKSMLNRGVQGQIPGMNSSRVELVRTTLSGDDGTKPRTGFMEIKVEDITPRSINRYKKTKVDSLAKSIRRTNNRLIHPIVLIRAEDMDPEGEVYKKFVEKGVDPATLKYVIVAGERRYRAWLQLRQEEAERHEGEIGYANPFNTITANVLAKSENMREEDFYEDSNDEVRQLTSLEVLLHVKDTIEDIKTDEQKKAAMKEMGIDSEKKKFNQAEYCKSYLENELGIVDVSISTIKQDLAILNNCHSRVVETVCEGKMAPRMARELYQLDVESQLDLLDHYEKGEKETFDAMLSRMKEEKRAPKTTRKNHRDAIKAMRDCAKKNKQKAEELKLIASDLGDKDRDQVNMALDALGEAIRTMEYCARAIEDRS